MEENENQVEEQRKMNEKSKSEIKTEMFSCTEFESTIWTKEISGVLHNSKVELTSVFSWSIFEWSFYVVESVWTENEWQKINHFRNATDNDIFVSHKFLLPAFSTSRSMLWLLSIFSLQSDCTDSLCTQNESKFFTQLLDVCLKLLACQCNNSTIPCRFCCSFGKKTTVLKSINSLN